MPLRNHSREPSSTRFRHSHCTGRKYIPSPVFGAGAMRSRAQISSHPIHPILVTFPIGLFITSLVFDAVAVNQNLPSLWAAAWYCILAGNIMGVAAAIPGALDLFSVVPPRSSARSRGYKHAILNALVLVLFISAAAYRGGPSARPDQTSFILSGIGVFCLLVSAWLGGTLVYR